MNLRRKCVCAFAGVLPIFLFINGCLLWYLWTQPDSLKRKAYFKQSLVYSHVISDVKNGRHVSRRIVHSRNFSDSIVERHGEVQRSKDGRLNSKTSKHPEKLSKFGILFDTSMDVFKHYPLDIDLPGTVQRIQAGETLGIQPVNQLAYSVLIENACEPQKELFMVYLIKSHPSSVPARMAVRQTWGNVDLIPGVNVKRIFILGTTDRVSQQDIVAENSLYKDILQGNFIDDYNHSSTKMEYAIQWVARSCSHVEFLVFLDNDVLIYPKNLVKLLKSPNVRKRDKLYLGWFEGSHRPSRRIDSKWYLSTDEYPLLVFPPLAPAATYVINQELARDLVIAMQYVRRVKFDDVFLAIVAKKLNVFPCHTDLIDVAGHLGPKRKERHTWNNHDLVAIWDEYSPDRLLNEWEILRLDGFV